MNGFTICRNLRDQHCTTPILILTALGEVEHRVQGLDSGADDYLTKPFAFAELEAACARCSGARVSRRRRSCNSWTSDSIHVHMRYFGVIASLP